MAVLRSTWFSFSVLLLVIVRKSAIAAELQFITLDSPFTLDGVDDGSTGPIGIYPSFPLVYGEAQHIVYINSNGLFSFGKALPNSLPSGERFSFDSGSPDLIVAPFWSDTDLSASGRILYSIFTTGSRELTTVSSYIVDERWGSFSGTWMLVAQWDRVLQFGGSSLSTNSFQGVLITDGEESYAIFTYRCGLMEWSDNSTLIGYRIERISATSIYSGSRADDIACANSPGSVWSNELYPLKESDSCRGFLCDNGQCIPLYHQCNGDYHCQDHSDERNCPDCGSDEFQCYNRDCIPKSWECNGANDCGDLSDEDHCSANCASDRFECDNHDCIPKELKCDSVDDCRDNSDEEDCVNAGVAVGLSVGAYVFVSITILSIIVVVYVKCRKRTSQPDRSYVGVITPPQTTPTEEEATQSEVPCTAEQYPMANLPSPSTDFASRLPPDLSSEPSIESEDAPGSLESPPPYPAAEYPLAYHVAPQLSNTESAHPPPAVDCVYPAPPPVYSSH